MSACVPDRVGVIGGGRMGSGIAHAFLMAGASVTVVERNAEAVAAADDRVLRSVRASIERGTSAPFGSARATEEWNELGDCDLVIEAVPEDRILKADALARAESLLGDD